MFVKKNYLQAGPLQVESFFFIPKKKARLLAFVAHGYTSSKNQLLPWATKLCEEGCGVALFDLPGHYLGSFQELTSFKDFTHFTPHLFWSAKESLVNLINAKESLPIVFMGHSLGALMALRALSLSEFKNSSKLCIAVGLGLSSPEEKRQKHVLQDDFFSELLGFRSQLVSPHLSPEVIFPWVQKEKENLTLFNEKVHLISGKDDLVVGKEGVNHLKTFLELNNNSVSVDTPEKLPHFLPELAAPSIRNFLKQEGLL